MTDDLVDRFIMQELVKRITALEAAGDALYERLDDHGELSYDEQPKADWLALRNTDD